MNTLLSAPRTGASRVVPALAVAGCLSLVQAAAEYSGELPEVALAPVTVSAFGGQAVPYDQTGVSVTVLDLPELKKEGVETLNEALAMVPGVAVQPGGLDQRGNTGNITIRGMSREQYTLPMMDGMRLYSFSGMNIAPNVVGRTDLFSLGRLEVLRGSQGAVYGAGAVGGVLYMETPEGQGEPSLTLFNEVGSFDSYTGNAVAQGRADKLAYYLSSTYERTNNDLAFADGRPITVKHAGHYEAWNEALRLDYELNTDNKLTVTYRREDASYKCLNAWGVNDYSFRSNLITAKLASRVNERFSSTLMTGYYGVDNMLGEGWNYNLRNVQLEWRNLCRWNERHSTTAGFAWNRSDYRCLTSQYGADMHNTLDNTYGAFAEHTYRPAKNWDNSLALRWDQSSVWDGLFSFRAASNYRFNAERTRVFASVGSGYKTPSALQCGGWYDAGYTQYVGNPDLDCERSLTADIGVEQQVVANHSLSATLFWARVEDEIDDVPMATPGVTTWTNLPGHVTSQGVELAARGTWEERWNTGYQIAFTYTRPKDNHDRQSKQTARQMWSAELHTSPVEGLTTGVGLSASVGRTDYARQRLDNYCILRWFARYQVNEQLTLHLRVENLTDERFISNSTGTADQGGALLNSGAAVYGGCTLTF